VCSVDGCQVPVVEETLACGDPDHRALYVHWLKGKGANFMRKNNTTTSKPAADSDGDQIAEDEEMETEEFTCPQKPEGGIQKLSARFGRRQTASEQFMVRPCGIVVARATFYGSETVPQVVVSLRNVNLIPR
jgi:hypothetical protein